MNRYESRPVSDPPASQELMAPFRIRALLAA